MQVDLAVKLADDDLFRPDMAKRMTVQPAKFEMHGNQYVPKKKANKKKSAKQKALEAQKVLGWGGFDDKLKASQVRHPLWTPYSSRSSLLLCGF